MPIHRCKQNFRIKDPAVVRAVLHGPLYEVKGSVSDFEAMGAYARARGLMAPDQHLLDLPLIAETLRADGYSGIKYRDSVSRRVAYAVLPTALIVNAKTMRRRRVNPLKADPTRTTLLRRNFVREVDRRFDALRRAVRQLVVVEDAFGLATKSVFTTHVFCPTGEGGGVDPTCKSAGDPSSFVDRVKAAKERTKKAREAAIKAHGTKEFEEAKNLLSDAKFEETRLLAEYDRMTKSTIGNLFTTHVYCPTGEGSSDVQNAGRFDFQTTPEKVEAFRRWLKAQVALQIVSDGVKKTEDQWWDQYIRQGFEKGIGRVYEDIHRYAKADPEMSDWYKGDREQFLRSSFGRPVAREKVQLLSGRVYTDIKGVTDQMSTKLTRTITDGMIQGKSPRDVGRELDGVLDAYKNQGRTVARTETIRAHAEGQLDAMERLGVEELGVMVEWSTSGQGETELGFPSPCELCEEMEGAVITLDEARGMLPRHPNCKCSWIPANLGESSEGQIRGRSALEKAILRSVGAESVKRSAAEQMDRTSWAGADVSIDKRRPESLIGNVFCPTGEGGGVDPSCSASKGRSAMAKRTHKPATAAKQRRGEAEQARLAKVVGGRETGDNLPLDVLVGRHAVEVKTVIDNDNDKITVHPDSRLRKERYARKNKVKLHTVAIDVRGGRRAYYHREGVGAYRLSAMDRVTVRELKERLR